MVIVLLALSEVLTLHGWLILNIVDFTEVPLQCLSYQYNFEGQYDIVKFAKLVGSSGLYLHLRIGPYVCAEWNFGSHPSLMLFHIFILEIHFMNDECFSSCASLIKKHCMI